MVATNVTTAIPSRDHRTQRCEGFWVTKYIFTGQYTLSGQTAWERSCGYVACKHVRAPLQHTLKRPEQADDRREKLGTRVEHEC